MSTEYQEENRLVLNNFLNRTFFKAWKNPELRPSNYDSLELQINSKCDKACSYCYYKKFGKWLNNFNKKEDNEKILNNLDLILNYLEENKMSPKLELFSGELFNQEIGIIALEKCIDFQIRNNIKNPIVIPTNGSFIHDNQKINKIESLIRKCRENKFILGLSFSIDGKYLDPINRPHINKEFKYTDEFYDKLFIFAKKWNFAFHPMIHHKGIEKWWDNFLWFQEMFKKHNINWDRIYLLEVRNDGWTKSSVKEFNNLIYKIFGWIHDNHLTVDNILNSKKLPQLMNLFSPFTICGRGMGCSIQSSVQLRLGDLTITPCHRTAYDYMNIGRFQVENNKIVDLIPLNVPLYLAINSTNNNNFPKCQDCLIKSLCSGGCLGAQYEANGDLFTPIESVCLLEHGKITTMLKWFKDKGKLKEFTNIIDTTKKESIEILKEWI